MSDHKDRTVNARMRRYRARLALMRAVRRALERGVDVRVAVAGILGDLSVTPICVTGGQGVTDASEGQIIGAELWN